MRGVAAAAEDGSVAGFDVEDGAVNGDVGSRFVDDADDADGYAHFADLDRARHVFQIADDADGVG